MKVEGVALGTVVAEWSGLAMAIVLLVEAIWIFVESDRFSEEFTFGCNAAFFAVNRDIFLSNSVSDCRDCLFYFVGCPSG